MTNGGGDSEGRIEICTNGIWMTNEGNYWNYNNAKVVCRQLGYHDTCKNYLIIFNVFTCVGSVAITDINWSGMNERVGYRYTCTGNENNLENCSKSLPSQYLYSWYNQRRGGVECHYNKTKSKLYAM